jgi:hypothetical protein
MNVRACLINDASACLLRLHAFLSNSNRIVFFDVGYLPIHNRSINHSFIQTPAHSLVCFWGSGAGVDKYNFVNHL